MSTRTPHYYNLRVGSLNGRNANTIFVVDGKPLHQEDAVLQVYGIPLHCGIDDLAGDRHDRHAAALAFANEVVGRWNAHDSLVQALQDLISVCDEGDGEAYFNAKQVLSQVAP